MATLLTVIRKMLELGNAIPPEAIKQDDNSIFQFGYIVSIQQDGNILVNLSGSTVNAVPVTDETFTTGQKICALRAENDTYIVLGSARI